MALATALTSIDSSLRKSFVEDISIATTAWLTDEVICSSKQKRAFPCLIKQVEDAYDVSLLALSSGLRFSNSSKKVLRDYESGYIKEGVGAGAFALLAQLNGFSLKKLTEDCEFAVDQLNSDS